MSENLPLSITVCADEGVTRYERREGRSCISISGDNDGLLLELQLRSWDLRDKEDLREEKTQRRSRL